MRSYSSSAAKRIGSVCRRVDQEEFVGDIVEEIQKLIRASVAGSPLSELPFDVRRQPPWMDSRLTRFLVLLSVTPGAGHGTRNLYKCYHMW